MSTFHTLSVLVHNRPGVLTRCAGLFARRGFNIDSLAVGPTEDPTRSRITIRVDCAQHSVDQVTKQLYKLVDVLKVQELGDTAVQLRADHDQGRIDPGAAAGDHRAGRGVRRPRGRRRPLGDHVRLRRRTRPPAGVGGAARRRTAFASSSAPAGSRSTETASFRHVNE